MTRALALVACALALVACARSGTGVELTIDPAGFVPDQLTIVAAYDGRALARTVAAPAGTALDLLAQLPDESTSVTFDVTAWGAGQPIAHGVSMAIAVTPHHIASATVTLTGGAPGGDDLGTVVGVPDLADGGVLWSHQQGTLPPGLGSINGLWGSSGSDVYAAATATLGVNLYRSTDHGGHWTSQLAGGSAIDLNGVGGTSASDVYLVGNSALILHGSGISWTAATSVPVAAATRLNGIYAIAPGDVYIVGSANAVLHGSAASGWVLQTVVAATELRAVWGVAGHIWAVGSGGTILKSTGTAWNPDPSGTGADLRSIWGSSATDVWVVGEGVMLHFDGNAWSPAADGIAAGSSLRALGGHVGGPLFAVGAGFAVYRRDPTTWVSETTGLVVDDPSADRLNALFVPSAVEAYAGGDGATILHRP